jgi:hypothetical protein
MRCSADRLLPATTAAICVWAWTTFGVGNATAQIVGYSPTQASQSSGTPNTYDPRFDRFTTAFGKPSNPLNELPLANAPPAPNASSFVAAGVDLSGVGWLTTNPGFSFAMISPRHFITAAHNGEGTFTPGASVTFFTGTATAPTTVTATVASSARVPSTAGSTFPNSDILLGTLNADVPSGVTSYAVPTGLRSQFTGLPVYIYTQNHAIGTNNVTQFFNDQNVQTSPPTLPNSSTNLVGYDFNSSGPTGETHFQTGDSGKPTFLNLGGQFALLGSHSAEGTVGSPPGTTFSFDAFLPDYITQMNAMMLGSGYQVRVVPVPEPTLVLTAAAVAAGAWGGWRRVRRGRRAGVA